MRSIHDPQALKRDVETNWRVFSDSPIRCFLSLWVERGIRDAQQSLEKVSSENLGRVQGSVEQLRRLKTLLETRDVTDTLRPIITELEAK